MSLGRSPLPVFKRIHGWECQNSIWSSVRETSSARRRPVESKSLTTRPSRQAVMGQVPGGPYEAINWHSPGLKALGNARLGSGSCRPLDFMGIGRLDYNAVGWKMSRVPSESSAGSDRQEGFRIRRGIRIRELRSGIRRGWVGRSEPAEATILNLWISLDGDMSGSGGEPAEDFHFPS